MVISDYKLGIFCPLFKGGDFITGYLENVVEQTIFKNVNFYVLDCASPDDEFQVIKNFSSKYSNIKYKRYPEKIPVYKAWNICIDWVNEPIIGNWNVDDRKTPWSLECLLNSMMLNPDLDLVYGKTIVSKIANERWDQCSSKEIYPCLPHSFGNLLANNSPHCMPIWKKSLHDKFGLFNEEYMTASDTDMWLRACKGGANMKMVNEIVGIYYENPNGISTNKEKLNEMIKEVISVRNQYR